MHKTCKNGIVSKIAWILLIIGGLNWGLVGIFDLDLVYAIFKGGIIGTIIYILVGISAVIVMFGCKKCCKGGMCKTEGGSSHMMKKESSDMGNHMKEEGSSSEM